MQAAVPRYATRMPTQVSAEKGVRNSKKPVPSEISFLSRMLTPVCMNGLVIATTFSRAAVRVSGAIARSASCREWINAYFRRIKVILIATTTLLILFTPHIHLFWMHQLWVTDASWVIQACAEWFAVLSPHQMSVCMYSRLSPPLQSSHSSSRSHPVCRMSHLSPAALCTWSPVSWRLQTAGPCKSPPAVHLWTLYTALA